MAQKSDSWYGRHSPIIRATNWMLLATWRLLVTLIGAIVRMIASRRARSIVDQKAKMIDQPGPRSGRRTRP